MNKGQFIDTDYYYDSIIKTPINYMISKTKTFSTDDIIKSYYDKIETDNLICYITDSATIPSDKLILLRLCKQISSNIYKIVFAKEQCVTALSSDECFKLNINIPEISYIFVDSSGAQLDGYDINSSTYMINNENIIINSKEHKLDLDNIKLTGKIHSITLSNSNNTTIDSIIPVEHLGKICLYSEYRGIYFEPIKKE